MIGAFDRNGRRLSGECLSGEYLAEAQAMIRRLDADPQFTTAIVNRLTTKSAGTASFSPADGGNI
ncbi:hypothetical protein [Bradyrhizobium sp. AS23.2]|uniref:hypothetical protein n=1 Tax=Bradyrhizobium sp. AS23.2 TaxID=1680155 RepID=UPI001160F9C8|nr:hypothetical protein [Bradyrhizobium sp. AS23.2]